MSAGPLAGVRVIELAGLGPGPFCGMVLADMGAEVLRVDRVGTGATSWLGATMERGKRFVGIDLKHPDGIALLLRLVEQADVLVDVFRPGVAERLGFGPDTCLQRNPRLVYGRLTGWGQEGPLAHTAGHDIDYIALAGALEPLGRAGQPPTPPINVLGDFAGGGMLLAFGVASALYERERSGCGQVVDAAMVDGAALLMAPFYTGRTTGKWGERGTNELDSAAPYYEVYPTADGRWLAVGAIEPQFYATLLHLLGLQDDLLFSAQRDRSRWPEMKQRLTEVFRSRTRDEWAAVFEGTDACVAPVLEPTEAPAHPHNRARGMFVSVDGVPQPAPAPRFSRTPAAPPGVGQPAPDEALHDWGVTAGDVARLRGSGVVG